MCMFELINFLRKVENDCCNYHAIDPDRKFIQVLPMLPS